MNQLLTSFFLLIWLMLISYLNNKSHEKIKSNYIPNI